MGKLVKMDQVERIGRENGNIGNNGPGGKNWDGKLAIMGQEERIGTENWENWQ